MTDARDLSAKPFDQDTDQVVSFETTAGTPSRFKVAAPANSSLCDVPMTAPFNAPMARHQVTESFAVTQLRTGLNSTAGVAAGSFSEVRQIGSRTSSDVSAQMILGVHPALSMYLAPDNVDFQQFWHGEKMGSLSNWIDPSFGKVRVRFEFMIEAPTPDGFELDIGLTSDGTGSYEHGFSSFLGYKLRPDDFAAELACSIENDLPWSDESEYAAGNGWKANPETTATTGDAVLRPSDIYGQGTGEFLLNAVELELDFTGSNARVTGRTRLGNGNVVMDLVRANVGYQNLYPVLSMKQASAGTNGLRLNLFGVRIAWLGQTVRAQ